MRAEDGKCLSSSNVARNLGKSESRRGPVPSSRLYAPPPPCCWAPTHHRPHTRPTLPPATNAQAWLGWAGWAGRSLPAGGARLGT